MVESKLSTEPLNQLALGRNNMFIELKKVPAYELVKKIHHQLLEWTAQHSRRKYV